METFLPDATTRDNWANEAAARGRTETFWRSTPATPARPNDGHKGTFGTALAVGGSRGMSGAIALTGSAALVAGAGLVRLFVPSSILDTVAQFQREYTTIPGAADSLGRFDFSAKNEILREANAATAVAVGPGLGRSDSLNALVAELFFELERPAVFDADALNALAALDVFRRDKIVCSSEKFVGRTPKAPRILTPHPGEFARLVGTKPLADESRRVAAAREFVERCERIFDDAEIVVALKGPGTVVADRRGVSIGKTGNANLATGGSGDALTGIILGLLAQGSAPVDATRAAVALHGLTAELRSKICSRGFVASDVVRFLPVAFDYYQIARLAGRDF